MLFLRTVQYLICKDGNDTCLTGSCLSFYANPMLTSISVYIPTEVDKDISTEKVQEEVCRTINTTSAHNDLYVPGDLRAYLAKESSG